MKKFILAFIFAGFCHSLSAQKTTPDSLLSLFPKTELPFCFEYSYEEQVAYGTVFEIDSTVDKEGDSTFVEYYDIQLENDFEPETLKEIYGELLKQAILPNQDSIYILDVFYEDTVSVVSIEEYMESAFYAYRFFKKTKSYFLVTYEMVSGTGYYTNHEKFLCTISRDGQFIDKLRVAGLEYRGTATGWSGGRIPWFAHERGCINEDLEIDLDYEVYGERKWSIDKKGHFVPVENIKK